MNRFRLDVWRPFVFDRDLYYATDESGTEGADPIPNMSSRIAEYPFARERLHQQVYSWSPIDDVWGGIDSEELRISLKEEFSTNFQADLRPSQRSVPLLEQFVSRLAEAAMKDSTLHWMPQSQPIDNNADDSIMLQASPTLALLRHLQWVCDTFRDVPGLSLTVR